MVVPYDKLSQLGRAFEALFTENGYSQNQLAAAAGISQTTVSNIVAGKSFEMASLLACLEVLKIELSELAYDAGLTTQTAKYQTFVFEAKMEARHVRHIQGFYLKEVKD